MLLPHVVSLAVTELIFFIATCMTVWFVFVARTVWVTHQSFGCSSAPLAQHWGFLLCLLCACPASRLGWARSWEGAQWDSSSDPQGFSPSFHFLPIPLEREGSEQLCECLDVNYGQLTALQNSNIILYKYFNCIVCLNWRHKKLPDLLWFSDIT